MKVPGSQNASEHSDTDTAPSSSWISPGSTVCMTTALFRQTTFLDTICTEILTQVQSHLTTCRLIQTLSHAANEDVTVVERSRRTSLTRTVCIARPKRGRLDLTRCLQDTCPHCSTPSQTTISQRDSFCTKNSENPRTCQQGKHFEPCIGSLICV